MELKPRVWILLCLIFLALSKLFAQQTTVDDEFRFRSGQSVYVIGLSFTSHNFNRLSANLEIERKAKEQFKRQKIFQVSRNLRSSDFVFIVVLDAESSVADEIALTVLPENYREFKDSIDDLRDHSLWSSSGRAKFGLSNFNILRKKSVAQDLVKLFHKESDVISEKK